MALAGIDSCVPAPLQTSLSALRSGASLLAGALKLGSAVLGGLAHVVEDVVEELAHLDSSELRDAPAEDAIATPAGFVVAREGTSVAPEGFLADTDRERTGPGVEDVVPMPGARPPARSSAPPPRSAPEQTPPGGAQSRPAPESESNGRQEPQPSAPAPQLGSAAPDAPPAPAQASGDGGPAPDGAAHAHVDEEAVLVAEFADPGAVNGAGAQIHIDEPWRGYRLLKAPEIVDRLVAEPDDVLALVLLYERAHRARRTVIAAAERELARRAA